MIKSFEKRTEPEKETEQARDVLDEFFSLLPSEYKNIYKELADHASSLGYRPVRNKTKNRTMDFRNGKTKKAIMKFALAEEKHDGFRYGERKLPRLRMRFFAAAEYSEIFNKAVQYVIERFDGKYTGCYRCGRCQGEPQGYHYTYPDGRQVFRCGGELLSIFDFGDSNLDEMKKLLDIQAEYDYKNIVKRG